MNVKDVLGMSLHRKWQGFFITCLCFLSTSMSIVLAFYTGCPHD